MLKLHLFFSIFTSKFIHQLSCGRCTLILTCIDNSLMGCVQDYSSSSSRNPKCHRPRLQSQLRVLRSSTSLSNSTTVHLVLCTVHFIDCSRFPSQPLFCARSNAPSSYEARRTPRMSIVAFLLRFASTAAPLTACWPSISVFVPLCPNPFFLQVESIYLSQAKSHMSQAVVVLSFSNLSHLVGFWWVFDWVWYAKINTLLILNNLKCGIKLDFCSFNFFLAKFFGLIIGEILLQRLNWFEPLSLVSLEA